MTDEKRREKHELARNSLPDEPRPVFRGFRRRLPVHRDDEDPADWEQAFKPLTKEGKEKYINDCGKQCAASFERIRRNSEEGFNLPIKLDGLIDEVVLKAGCTSDYRESVEEALGKAGLSNITIRESQP